MSKTVCVDYYPMKDPEGKPAERGEYFLHTLVDTYGSINPDVIKTYAQMFYNLLYQENGNPIKISYQHSGVGE